MNEKLLSRKIRIKVLQFIAGQRIPPTYKELAKEIGAASVVAARYQVGVLIEEGLIEKIAGHRGLLITTTGKVVLGYLEAALTMETVIERKVREAGLVPNREVKRTIAARAKKQDEDSFERRQQLRRRLKGMTVAEGLKEGFKGGREMERKVEAVEVLESAGRHVNLTEMARELGIVPSSLRERIDNLIAG